MMTSEHKQHAGLASADFREVAELTELQMAHRMAERLLRELPHIQNLTLEDLVKAFVTSGQAKEKIEQAKITKNLEKQAMQDALTGAYNRRYIDNAFSMECERIKRDGESALFVVLDIDRFKQINDTYGHAFGDEVLRVFVDRIRQAVRPYDLVARYGGEEFAVLISGSVKKCSPPILYAG